jgi:hypothetical protein
MRFSDEEYALVLDASRQENIAIGDLVRRTLLAALRSQKADLIQSVLLQEVVFLRMLLSNSVPHILAGTKLPDNQISELMQRLKELKPKGAEKALADAAERGN